MYRSIPVALFTFALAGAAQPAAAQDASACVDEVQRLSETFPLADSDRPGAAPGEQPARGAEARPAAGPIAQQPGARRGASLGTEQRQQVSSLIQQARAAGERGDSQACMQNLTEARVLLRQAGVGSPLPGSAADARGPAGSGGGSAAAGAPGTAGSAATPPGGRDALTTGAGPGGRAGTTGDAMDSPAARGRTGGEAPGATSGGSVGATSGGTAGATAGGNAAGGGGGGGTR